MVSRTNPSKKARLLCGDVRKRVNRRLLFAALISAVVGAAAIMAELYKANKLTAAQMDEKLEWTYYELWHHEGRRARHGAAMSGPDYAWWHGIYDVAKNFYLHFIPEVKEAAGEQLGKELIDKYVYSQPGHRWLKEGMSKDQLQQIQEFYRQR